MVQPIILKKDKDRFENDFSSVKESDYQRIIKSVDLYELTSFIESLNREDWVPDCYWKKGREYFYKGELWWAIYSYLITKKLLIIENQYFGYNKREIEKYKKRTKYYNTLENCLYIPIGKRLFHNMFIDNQIPGESNGFFKIGSHYKSIKRTKRIDSLDI